MLPLIRRPDTTLGPGPIRGWWPPPAPGT